MNLSYHSRNAATAKRVKKKIQREGRTMRGDKVWEVSEDEVLRSLYPNYTAMVKALPHRSYRACRTRSRHLGIVKPRPPYTARELSVVRRLYPEGDRDDILALLPGRTWDQIKDLAKRHKIRRIPKPFKPTGTAVLDQIRSRCRDLNYTMSDLDKLARSKGYFSKANWLNGHIHHRDIGRAVDALFGDLKVDWKE